MAMSKLFKGSVSFTSDSNSVTVQLPSQVAVSRTLPIIQSRNNEDSTWGGSAGNCLMTPKISADGLSLIIERVRNWNQSIIVDWQVIEFSQSGSDAILTGETVINTTNFFNTLTTSQQPYQPIPFCDIRGSGVWSSDMSNYLTSISLNGGAVKCGGVKPIGTIVRYYVVPFQFLRSDDTGISISEYVEDVSKVSGDAIVRDETVNASFSARNFVGFANASFNTPADSRDIPNWSVTYDGTLGAKLIASQYNSKAFNACGFIVEQYTPVAYHGKTTLANGIKSATVSLPSAVKIEEHLALLNAPFTNFAETDSYGEEFGDFSVTATLVDRGDGFANSINLRRGISDGTVTSRISWTVLWVKKVSAIIPVNFDYYYRQRRVL